jgi:hypothetical protein
VKNRTRAKVATIEAGFYLKGFVKIKKHTFGDIGKKVRIDMIKKYMLDTLLN